LQLLKGGVGTLRDETAKPIQGVIVEDRRLATGVGPGIDRTALTSPLEQSCDAGDVNGESACQFAPRSFVPIDGRDDAFSEILGEGSHPSPPFEGSSFYKPCAIRM
jgi:hypothetical protein